MDKLLEQSDRLIRKTKYNFKRYLEKEINWEHRLIAIQGARGVGKTTMMLQRIKDNYKIGEAIYLSLDNLYFSNNTLIDTVEKFVNIGGIIVFLDEVHKYPNWSIELKNIYDLYPDLKIVFSASSILDIYKGFGDLSRRAVSYSLLGLSLREYLELNHNIKLDIYSMENLLNNHIEIAENIINEHKMLHHFKNYLKYGYYPFYNDMKEKYHESLERIINIVLDTDIPQSIIIELSSIPKIRKLLAIISESVPFKPNISKLAERIEISRNTLLTFLEYLERAKIILNLSTGKMGISKLSKPDKIYLDNSNLLYALSMNDPEIGTVRETFFNNQLRKHNKVSYSSITDFLVNDYYSFEIGGANKNYSQIIGTEKSFIAADDLEVGSLKKIPLYLFGLTY